MEEITNIEEIEAFAKATHRSFEFEETPYPLTGIQTFQKYKRWVYMPNDQAGSSYFVWYSDAYAKIGEHLIFCGAFIPLESKIESNISIRRKNILDKLSFSSNKNKTGDNYFDSKVVVSGTMDAPTKSLLSQPRLQEELISAMKLDHALNISINQNNVDFVPALKGKSHLAIINTRNWNLDNHMIESMLQRIERIRDILG